MLKDKLAKQATSFDVKVAHLDTGYFPPDELTPEYMLHTDSKDFINPGRPEGDRLTDATSGHGSHTLSALAGGQVAPEGKLSGQKNARKIGAYPDMKVAEESIKNGPQRTSPSHVYKRN